VQSFTARMPLLTATSAFRLGRSVIYTVSVPSYLYVKALNETQSIGSAYPASNPWFGLILSSTTIGLQILTGRLLLLLCQLSQANITKNRSTKNQNKAPDLVHNTFTYTVGTDTVLTRHARCCGE